MAVVAWGLATPLYTMAFEIEISTKIFRKISSRSGGHGMAKKTTSFISMFHCM
jgi:hypothetical protein